jgi:hypothetical protein
MEGQFMHRVKLYTDPVIAPIFIRADSHRPELSHRVIEVPTSVSPTRTTVDITFQLVQNLLPRLQPGERMIVFSMTVEDTKALSERLACSRYHSAGKTGQEGMEDEQKVAHYQAWKAGHSEVIVATAALIQGIDFASVKVVIFHKGAFGMISYYQGAGRGGRSGLPCDVYTVWDRRDPGRLKASDAEDLDAMEEWGMFLKKPGCRMAAITGCFDRKAASCADIDGQRKCDLCEPNGERGILALTGTPQTSAAQAGHSSERQSGKRALEGGRDHEQGRKKSRMQPTISLPGFLEGRRESSAAASMARGRSQGTSSHLGPRLDLRTKLSQPTSSPSALPNWRPTPQRQAAFQKRMPSQSRGAVTPAPSFTLIRPEFPLSTSPRQRVQEPTSSRSPGCSRSSLFARSPPDSDRPNRPPTPALANSSRHRVLGTALMRSAAAVRAPLEVKRKKTALLDQIMGAVGRGCLICSILAGDASGEELSHRSLQDCDVFLGIIEGRVPDWEDKFQTFRDELQLPGGYLYCWHCGMPQEKNHNRLEPKCHKAVARGGGPCGWSGYIYACLFALYWDKRRMEDLGLGPFLAVEDWAQWLMKIEREDAYWNGLELFLSLAGARLGFEES